MRQEESKWVKFFYSRWFFIVFVVLFVLILFAFLKSYYQDYQVRQEIKRLEQEAAELGDKKIESLEILKYVQSDEFTESRARQEFNMRLPGENVAVILSTTGNLSSGQPEDDVIKLEKSSNFKKWLKIFLN